MADNQGGSAERQTLASLNATYVYTQPRRRGDVVFYPHVLLSVRYKNFCRNFLSNCSSLQMLKNSTTLFYAFHMVGFIYIPIGYQLPVKCRLCLFRIFTSQGGISSKHLLTALACFNGEKKFDEYTFIEDLIIQTNIHSRDKFKHLF